MAREAKSFSEMLKEKLKKGPLGKVAASFRELKYKRSVGAAVKTETSDKKTGSVVKKRNYFKIGFYSFGVAFIVIGIIYILIFINIQDPSLFGSSRKYYDRARQSMLEGDYEDAEKYLDKCLKSDKTNSDAIYLLAELYDTQQRYDDELSLLTQAVQDSAHEANSTFYRRILQIYVIQNRMDEAFDLINNLDAYMIASLSSSRPANIQASPDGGVYDTSVNVTFVVPSGSVIYYTTDGSTPNLNSSVYNGEPISITKDTVTVRAVAINDANLPSNEYRAQFRIYSDNTPYEFEDPKVEQIVRAILDKASGDVYYRDLTRITSFSNNISGVSSSQSIKTLSDLTALTNLRTIELSGESAVEDYSVLSAINTLESISLTSCKLTSENLSQLFTLTNISKLYLSGNNISSVDGISALNHLTELDLSQNNISSVSSLSGLNSLSVLDLSGNVITDLSGLSSLSSLSELDLSDNSTLTNLNGLSSLTRLKVLRISNLDISSLSPLSTCTGVEEIYADGCKISDVDALATCRSLKILDVSNTGVTSFISLAQTPISQITANNCQVNSSAAFSGLSSLTNLTLKSNALTEVLTLASLNMLQNLDISGNPITDVSMLIDCVSLKYLNCSGIDVSGSVLSQFEAKGVMVVS